MRIFEKISEKKIKVIFVLLVILVGIFFRAYHFSDWLHFEIDQVHDIDSISQAVDKGIENLPLLGTNAGGGALRLGPAFYYLEYVSAKIFGNTPPGYAMVVLILSILSLPLFYLFSRLYFSTKISVALLTVFSCSVYFIQYSRFAWSPNVLPFFILLSFYALLRSVSKNETRKNLWFLISVASITICTQIHFNSLLVVSAVSVIFLFLKRPHFSWKVWFSALGIVILLYSPMIIHEIKTNAKNSHYFTQKVAKTSKNKISLPNAFIQSIRYNALEFWLVISGHDTINNSQDGNVDECRNCLSYKIFIVLGWIYLIASLTSLFALLRKEKDKDKKDFIIICGLWFLLSWGLYFSLIKGGYTMQARFVMISAPLAIVFLGLSAKAMKLENAKRFWIILLVTFFLLFSNGLKIKSIFAQLKNAGSEKARIEQEDIFPNTGRITLAQQYAIINYLQSNFSQNSFPVYLESNRSEYEATFWYHLNRLGVINYGSFDTKNLCEEANYYVIKTNNDQRSIVTDFDILEIKDFGTLTVFHLMPKKGKIVCGKALNLIQHFTDPEEKAKEMLTWKEAFSGL